MKPKKQRQEEAAERDEESRKRSPQDQISKLDAIFGEGQGAKKERAKLERRIAMQKEKA